jgi:hypothetical protein
MEGAVRIGQGGRHKYLFSQGVHAKSFLPVMGLQLDKV